MSVNEFEQLLDRYNRGACSPEEKLLMEEWLNNAVVSNPSSWQHMPEDDKQALIDRLCARIGSTVSEKPAADPYALKRRKYGRYTGIAAAFISLLAIGYFLFERQVSQPFDTGHWQKLVAEPGDQKKFRLADGTVIWLQGGSELLYPTKFRDSRRLVQLEGEAFFEVAPDQQHPFMIKSGNMETNVLGTSFNIKAFPGLTRYIVSLVDGKVAVQLHANNSGNTSVPMVLSPGEELVYNLENGQLIRQLMPSTLTAGAYKSGNLQFERASLHEVFFILGKAYGLDIQYDTGKAKTQKMTGNFARSQPVDEVLKSVAAITGGSYTRKGRKIEFLF